MNTAKATIQTLSKAVVLTALLVFVSMANAESIAVVTQEGVQIASLSREEVADLFLGKRKILVAGQTLTPVDVSDESLRDSFYQKVAEMRSVRVKAYWARLVFSAQGRPPRELKLTEAKHLIQSESGYVTYLPANTAEGFNVVLRLP
jgi:hypothetical protein